MQSGTSMAAGHVSAAAGLVLGENPGLTAARLKERLCTTGERMAHLMGNVRDGRSLDAAQALAGEAQDGIVYMSPEEDFDIDGYAPTPEESWVLFSSKSIVQVAAGEGHTIALASDGGVWAWGSNDYGQCGIGSASYSSPLAQVVGLTKVKHIAAGGNHSLAVKADGSVWAWGSNGFGELGDGSTTDRAVPVQAVGLVGAKSCSAGVCHSLAVTASGGAYGWGDNYYGQAGSGSINVCETTPVPVAGLTGASSVAAGGYHSMALYVSGGVSAWGCNFYYQLGDWSNVHSGTPVQVKGLANMQSIAAGEYHSLALDSSGNVFAWGSGMYGQLGDGSGYSLGIDPSQVAGLAGVESIAAGRSFCLAVGSNGDVFGWGDNCFGQLGDGSTTDAPMPVQAAGLGGATLIAAGGDHSLAVAAPNCSLWAWGSNCYGQLGIPPSYMEALPVMVLTCLPATDMETRTVHGYVYAMPTVGTPSLKAKHAISVELREAFHIPAPPELCIKAVHQGSTSNSTGEFTIKDVPYGDYVLYIKRPGCLARPMLVTVSDTDPDTIELAPPGVADGGVFKLWPGDCNNDNVINNDDTLLVLEHYGIKNPDPLYSADYDLNMDGEIGLLDMSLVLYNGGKTSGDYAGAEGVDVTFPLGTPNVLLLLMPGNEYRIPLRARDVGSFSGMTINVTYDPAKLQLLDAAEQAYGAHTSAGPIPGTGITITSVSPGNIALAFDAPVPPGEAWSGAITVLKFKALTDGPTTVSVV